MSMVAIINADGETSIHIAGGVAGYHTICGISVDDDQAEESLILPGSKIDCPSCKNLWIESQSIKRSDFASGNKP